MITVSPQETSQRHVAAHVVFHDVNLTINRGEKVAFVGKNGEGKSTLVKCIMSEIDFEGKLTLGHNVQIGYFAQNQAQMLDENLTVFDTIDRVAVGDIRLKIRDILGAFMFGGEASDKKVKVLSGGEKVRCLLSKMMISASNVLLLDEPTNHLDMESITALNNGLIKFPGVLLFSSRDHQIVETTANRSMEIVPGGKLIDKITTYDEYLANDEMARKRHVYTMTEEDN